MMTILRSKVGIAVLGAVLVGGTSAALAATTAMRPGASTGTPNTANTDPNTGMLPSPTSPSASATPTSPATATSAPTATRTPRPTATLPPVGQTVDLHGSINNINYGAGTFTLYFQGVHLTIVTTPGVTQYQGSSQSFNGLQNGWKAEVKGQMQTDGTFLASLVNSSSDT
jgi:hypothetical protein